MPAWRTTVLPLGAPGWSPYITRSFTVTVAVTTPEAARSIGTAVPPLTEKELVPPTILLPVDKKGLPASSKAKKGPLAQFEFVV